MQQQIREKKLLKEQEEFKATMEFQQQEHLTQMLKETQEKHAQLRKDMQASTVNANKQLAKEKRDRDMASACEMEAAAQKEVDFTLTHDFMTENPTTEQILQDREDKRKRRGMEYAHREFQESQKTEHEANYKDPYGEKHTDMAGNKIEK